MNTAKPAETRKQKACNSGSSIHHYSTRQKLQLDELHNDVKLNSSYRIVFSPVDLENILLN
jgi:hypothetical protein